MRIIREEKPSLDELAHHGVVGMKWGVHKQKQLDLSNRVASGHGSFVDKVKMNVSLVELLTNKGSVQRIAAGRAALLDAQKKRIESGSATKLDKIDRALNAPVLDLIRGR